MNFLIDQDEVEYQSAPGLQKRKLSEEQLYRFERYIAEIFTALGMDLGTPSTRETPRLSFQPVS